MGQLESREGRVDDQDLSFAELQAKQPKPMHIMDWIRRLNDILNLNDREILSDAGRISARIAKEMRHHAFSKFQMPSRDTKFALQFLKPYHSMRDAVKLEIAVAISICGAIVKQENGRVSGF